jgi:mono/diheme cytochrome c family protein
MKQHIKHHSITVAAVLIVLAVGAGAFVFSGMYNIGADDHHTKPVFMALQTLRDRSIHQRSKSLEMPDLKDPALVLKGAGQYTAMCTDCHLSPGMTDSEIRPGLYPQPPNLSQVRIDPRDAFWAIKHGLKMTAMPAWGLSHDDATIWSLVAFVQRLPDMSPQEYKEIVAKAPPDEDMKMPMGMGTKDSADAQVGHVASASSDGKSEGTMTAMPGMKMNGMKMPPSGEGAKPEAAEKPKAELKPANAAVSMDGMTPKAAPEAEAAAVAFHTALQNGDRAGVLALLAPEAKIREDATVQSRAEYAGGHLAEDIAFLKRAKVKTLSLVSMDMGDSAMVGSQSESVVTLNGKVRTLRGREMLDLKRVGSRWKITAIQWDSLPSESK